MYFCESAPFSSANDLKFCTGSCSEISYLIFGLLMFLNLKVLEVVVSLGEGLAYAQVGL